MVFRLTSKARKKLRLADSELASPGPEVAAAEWYCNVITLARRPFFLVANSLSLFGVLVPAVGNTTPDSFGKSFRQATAELLRRYGIGHETARRVVDDGPDSFTKATDRHVIGSMLDFANLSKFVIEQEGHAWSRCRPTGARVDQPIADESHRDGEARAGAPYAAHSEGHGVTDGSLPEAHPFDERVARLVVALLREALKDPSIGAEIKAIAFDGRESKVMALADAMSDGLDFVGLSWFETV